MQVWEDVTQVPADWPASVVTIGVFDGVHVGHRELIRHTVQRAALLGLPAVVLTFWPNPVEVVKPGDPPARLATLAHRLEIIATLGVDATLVLPFTPEMAKASPEFFAGSVLSDALGAAEVVVGENFRFGHRARGTVDTLTQLGVQLGFTVTGTNLFTTNSSKGPISSTAVRELVAAGDVAAATRALARPHRVEGTVVSGDGRGKELGFPTANVESTPFSAIPADGVYGGRMVIDPYGEKRVAVAAISVGSNPTFDDVIERRVEAWAYEESNLELYDQYVAIDFVGFVRGQVKFDNESELGDAVARDVEDIRALLGA